MVSTRTAKAKATARPWPAWQLFVIVGASYAAGSQLAYVWFGADGTGASFFPAAGVTLAALVLTPRRRWWVVLTAAGLAELAVDLLHDLPVDAALGYTCANLVQPVLGALLLRLGATRLDISRSADLLRFLGAGVVIAPIAGAVVGATTFTLVQDGGGWGRFALEWWAGDGLGILIVGSAILAWSTPPAVVPSAPIETAALIGGTIAATALAFGFRAPGVMPIALALLMTAAVRTRTRGVAAAGAGAGLVAASFIAGANPVWGAAELDTAVGMLNLQLALAVTLGTALALAAEVNAREIAVAGTAALEAAGSEQELVGTDDALLATISLALQAVTTVDERRRSLTQVLHDHRGIEASVEVVRHERAPTDQRSPADGRTEPDGAIERVLRARGREVGLLRLRRADGSPLGLRPAFVDALSVVVGLAIENAVLYERERDASHAFQVGLLGGPLPRVDGCELGASYRSAGSALEVGGDWHDAFELPSGRVALVVGDVVGKGLVAAIAMGQLRDAVRSLAPFSTPAEVLIRLDEVVANVPEARGSTLVYVEYDPSSGQIRHASAGHPPPVVVSPRTQTGRLLAGGRSTPLGYGREVDRPEARNILAERELLVLYTDGLIERRSARIDEGLARLRGVAGRMVDLEVDAISDRLLEAMAPTADYTDDVCTLVVRALPREVFSHQLEGGPDALSGCRAAVQAWLGTYAATEEEVQGVVLAVDEAVSNCIEHGYGGRRGSVQILCSVTDGRDLLCVVRDEGRWVEPVERQGRGWGRGIMATVMDEVEVDIGEVGTEVRLTRSLAR